MSHQVVVQTRQVCRLWPNDRTLSPDRIAAVGRTNCLHVGPAPMSVPNAILAPALCERARASLIFTRRSSPSRFALGQHAVTLRHLQNRDAGNDRRHMKSAFGDEQLERASVEEAPVLD